jgi:PAS domain S-box-containing protein
MRTLRNRFLAATLAAQAVALLLLLAAGHRIMDQVLADQLAVQGETVRELLNAAVTPQLAARDYGAVQELASSSVASLKLAFVKVYVDGERLVAQAGDNGPDVQPREVAGIALHGDVYRFGHPLTLSGQVYGRFEVGLPATQLIAAKQRTVLQTVVIGGAALLVSMLLLWPMTSVLTRRLTRLAAAAERISRSERDVRVPVQGQDEVARVSQAFNEMSQALGERVAALQDAEARQRALVEALAEGVVFQDRGDRILSCNDAASRILGLSREQMLGRHSMDPEWRVIRRDGSPLPHDQHPSVVACRTGEPQRDALMGVQRPDGTRVWLQVNSQPLKREGEATAYATVTSFADITTLVEADDRLRQLNAELEQRVTERTADLVAARDAAERASQAKTEFMSRMSHELRTPLNAILGFAQVLQLGSERPASEQRASVAHIERAGWHLLELINELLDLSRIEAGALSVSLEPVELEPLAGECLRMVEPAANAQRVRLRLQAPPFATLAAHADRTRLRQVLMNLLSNAIKYNRDGGEVVMTLAASGEAVTLAIRDTGRGFTPEQQAQLYEPFNRLGADHVAPGTGIGLVITRRLVELMHGSLELASQPGVGSTFTVRLPSARLTPMRALPPPAAASADAPGKDRRNVLYIEDNPSNVQLLKDVLALRPGIDLHVASTGGAGIAMARSRQPDLVLVDIDLPDIDGTEVCRQLRADPQFAGRPLLALSANALPADIARGALAGFDAYLTKPIDVGGLLRQLDRFLAEAP